MSSLGSSWSRQEWHGDMVLQKWNKEKEKKAKLKVHIASLSSHGIQGTERMRKNTMSCWSTKKTHLLSPGSSAIADMAYPTPHDTNETPNGWSLQLSLHQDHECKCLRRAEKGRAVAATEEDKGSQSQPYFWANPNTIFKKTKQKD